MHVSWELCDRCWRRHQRVMRGINYRLRVVIGKLPPDDEYMPNGPDARHVDLCWICLLPTARETMGLEHELRRAQQPDHNLGHCYQWLQEHLDALTDAQRLEWWRAHTGAWPWWTGPEEDATK